MSPVLRDYQIDNKRMVEESFIDGLMKLLVVMPTGTGKTTVFSSLAMDWSGKGDNTLIVVHRVELMDQVIERLSLFGILCGRIVSGRPLNLAVSVQVAMIKSIPTHLVWKPDYVVIDECHHSTATSYARLWKIFPGAKFVGFTATPIRLDGKTFDRQFERMISIYPQSWYTRRGDLVRAKHYVCSDTIARFEVVKNDYDLKAMSRVMRVHRKIADVVKSYQIYTPNKQAVVFAVDLDHSMDIVRRFNECGIPAAHLDGDLESDTRRRIIEQFRKREIRVISNFDIVSEGFDVPSIEAIIFARLSKSLSFFIQAVGRCLRPDKGKEFGYVLDCSGMWMEHGVAGMDYPWSLRDPIIKKALLGSRLFGTDRHGRVYSFVKPTEDPGIELCQLNEELGRLKMFDLYLEQMVNDNGLAREAVRLYDDYLRFQGLSLTKYEIRYCQGAMNRFGDEVPDVFWEEFQQVA